LPFPPRRKVAFGGQPVVNNVTEGVLLCPYGHNTGCDEAIKRFDNVLGNPNRNSVRHVPLLQASLHARETAPVQFYAQPHEVEPVALRQ
jgi:hypothetical protein